VLEIDRKLGAHVFDAASGRRAPGG
jgi:hypothetical protein